MTEFDLSELWGRFPREIQIQTNSLCNGRCIMCPYPEVWKELSHGTMQDDLYKKIIDECSEYQELRIIQLFLMNEPLMDRNIVARINYTKEKNPNAIIAISSNGLLLTPHMAHLLVGSQLDVIFLSFNGASKESYERVMRLDYNRVISNISYLVDLQPKRLEIVISMVDMKDMQSEIERNIAYWESRGVGWRLLPMVNRGGNVSNFNQFNSRKLTDEPTRPCPLFYVMCILYNGDVILCCADWHREVVMGNVKEQSLYDIWRSDKYNYYRGMHLLRRTNELELCQDCSFIRTPVEEQQVLK